MPVNSTHTVKQISRAMEWWHCFTPEIQEQYREEYNLLLQTPAEITDLWCSLFPNTSRHPKG